MKKISGLLLCLGCIFSSFAQQTLQGKVTNNKDAPLEGVSVSVKGTNTSVVTGIDGSFEIKTGSGKATLLFSHTGYQTVELTPVGSAALSGKDGRRVTINSRM
jgi:hypothetical protein